MVILNQEASDDTINEASLNPLLALFRTGFLGAAHGWGVKAVPSLKFVAHILQWWNLAQLHVT